MAYISLFGIKGSGTGAVLVSLALVVVDFNGHIVQADDSEQPSLYGNRLFLSDEDRQRYDQPAAPVPIASAVPASVDSPPLRRSISVHLDGYVRQPNGRLDVWVNGRLVDGRSGIGVSRISRNGSVVLSVDDREITLRPGQQERVLVSGSR